MSDLGGNKREKEKMRNKLEEIGITKGMTKEMTKKMTSITRE